MKKVRILQGILSLVCMVLMPSCASCWEGGIPMRSGEVAAHRQAVADLRNGTDVKVYRGLAHPKKQRALYEKQLKTEQHFNRYGFEFYQKPLSLPHSTVKQLEDLYADPQSHQTYSIKDLCRYHPDYMIVWKTGSEEQCLQICYGCHEWRHFCSRGMLKTDINEPAYFDKLIKILPDSDERP